MEHISGMDFNLNFVYQVQKSWIISFKNSKTSDILTAAENNIQTWHNHLIQNILAKDISGSASLIRQKARESGLNQYLMPVDDIMENYRLMLGFFERGTPDERRMELHDNIIRQVLELSDRLKEDLMLRSGSDTLSRVKREWLPFRKPYGSEAVTWAEELAAGSALDEIFKSTQLEMSHHAQDRKLKLGQLFNLAWLPDKLQDEEAEALTGIILGAEIPWYERAVLCSGLSLGLLRSFDKTRISTLLKLTGDKSEEVRVRALTGLIFSLILYHERLPYYPKLQESIQATFDISIDPREVEAILLQWIRSQDTEELGRTLREELLPGMMRITPKITERLKLDEIFPGEESSDKNPDWEGVFSDDPELLNKLQQFTERHLAGDDVFMSVFSHQKHYPFFQQIMNWFLPFHTGEPIIEDILATENMDSGIKRLIEELESTHLLSHSDKYSFALNLGMLSEMQKDLLKASFGSEMEEYRKIAHEEETLDDLAAFRNVLRMYIQDLYRFFELHEYRHAFPAIFNFTGNKPSTGILSAYLRQHNIDRTLAYFHFEREHWRQAANALSLLAENTDPTQSLFEKAGYAYQQIQEFDHALAFYRKAELFDTNRSWLLKRMAYCYRKSGKTEDALRIYAQAMKEFPEDLSLLVNSANILLESRDYTAALQQYQEAELRDADNVRLLRPIAWCCIHTGVYKKALRALERIPEVQRTYYDFMNTGHACWMAGNIVDAVANYKRGLSLSKDTADDFMKGFKEDRPILHQAGIAEAETAMMADLLRELQISD